MFVSFGVKISSEMHPVLCKVNRNCPISKIRVEKKRGFPDYVGKSPVWIQA